MRDSWGAGGPLLAFACEHLDRPSLHLLDIQCPSRSDAGSDLHSRRGDWEARKSHQPMMLLALEAPQATGTQDGAAADFAPVVISDVTWSHSLQRGLPVHDLEGPGATLQFVCDLDRVFGPQPHGSFAVTLLQERAPARIAVPAQTGEQAVFEPEGGRVAHRQMHLAPLAPARRTMLAGKPFAIGAKADTGAVRCPAGQCAAMSQ